MKKLIKPGFELIFSLSLVAILGLPPLVLAQSQKNIEIKITNGDTTINGKDIKKLSAQERKEALAEIDNLPTPPMFNNNTVITNRKVVITRDVSGDNNNNQVTIERTSPAVAGTGDSSETRIHLKRLKGNSAREPFTYQFDNELPPMEVSPFRFNGPNTRSLNMYNHYNQVFNYTNTDDDGISTNITFRVADASKEKLKAIAGAEKAELAINDLSIVPEFSTGKTTISFTLPAKAAADVRFTDTQGKLLWADKTAGGNFTKKVSLPLNGVYYLQVKQGAKVTVKKIIKD